MAVMQDRKKTVTKQFDIRAMVDETEDIKLFESSDKMKIKIIKFQHDGRDMINVNIDPYGEEIFQGCITVRKYRSPGRHSIIEWRGADYSVARETAKFSAGLLLAIDFANELDKQ